MADQNAHAASNKHSNAVANQNSDTMANKDAYSMADQNTHAMANEDAYPVANQNTYAAPNEYANSDVGTADSNQRAANCNTRSNKHAGTTNRHRHIGSTC